MNIEKPDRAENRESAETTLTKLFSEAATREIPDTGDIELQKNALLAAFEKRFTELLPEQRSEIEKLAQEIRKTNYSDKSEFVYELSTRLSHLLVAIAPAEELERMLRERTAEQRNWRTINEALSYTLEDANSINLHVPIMFTKSPVEMYRLFINGLKILAEQMKNDPELFRIQQVMGYSWIISDHPEILRKLGFTVEERNEKEHKALAWILKEDFLARYGN